MRFRSLSAPLTLVLLLDLTSGAAERRVPTVDDLLTLKVIGSTQISPDGSRVAYTVSETDFEHDAFLTHIWVVESATWRSVQLTRGDKTATSPKWSPDGKWLAFLSPRVGDRIQIFAIRPDGGEAMQLTKSETPISSFSWSHDGKQIAFIAPDAPTEAQKDRKEYLGDYEVVRKDYQYVHVWTIDVEQALRSPLAGRQRTKGRDLSVASFAWSPDDRKIAFSATVNPDLINGSTADIYVLTTADDRVKKIVDQPGPDNSPEWSPDGQLIAFTSAMGRDRFFALTSRIAVVDADGGQPRSVSDSFDEMPSLVDWTPTGLYFTALQKTSSHLFRVDPISAAVSRVSAPDDLMGISFTLTADGRRLAYAAGSSRSLPEVFVSDVESFTPRALTESNTQTLDFVLGTRELVSWKSKDGATIEGVLIKPADFDPGKRYPLLCIIHGGPTGIDRPVMLTPDSRYYPSDIWVGRGALVLKVNYRGSAGYGEKFRTLNVRNLGVGDAWDVISGVDMLVAKGWVDPAKVASMGWSQGGYISAFLTTSSDRFCAISVGAGISNWATYYYNTDITPFTLNYLGDDPADDPEIYRKTSPMSYIKQARTPTLIQHGELDRRVPIPNAYELRQGLEDRGLPVEMIVYKGFGHGITKPRAMRAVMQHNLTWFNHYLWGDPKPDFSAPEMPKKKKDTSTPKPNSSE